MTYNRCECFAYLGITPVLVQSCSTVSSLSVGVGPPVEGQDGGEEVGPPVEGQDDGEELPNPSTFLWCCKGIDGRNLI